MLTKLSQDLMISPLCTFIYISISSLNATESINKMFTNVTCIRKRLSNELQLPTASQEQCLHQKAINVQLFI